MSDALQDLVARRPTVACRVELTPAAKDEFRTRGFIRIDRITSDEEVAWLRDVYDLLFGHDTGAYIVRDVMTRLDSQRGDRVSQIIRPEDYLPELKETQFWANGRRLGAELLGLAEEQMEGWGHMIRKAPRDEEAVPFHQDEAYWNPWFDYRSLGVWMPLDPATVESGCMSMVPGSHLRGIRPHALRHGDPTVTLIDMVDPPVREAVAAPVPIGGASFHHCRTIHGSGPNVSDHPRRAVIAEWQAAPVRRDTPKDHPWFWPRHEAMMELAPERMTHIAEAD